MIAKIMIVIIAVMFAGAVVPVATVHAEGGAYQRGYSDAVCDSSNCHGHGYDPSCPSGHSDDYCSNYQAGYSAGWNNNSFRDTSSEAASIGGNKINGDHNTINQQIVQSTRQHSDNSALSDNNDHNDGGDNSGQLPRCKLFCLGVQ